MLDPKVCQVMMQSLIKEGGAILEPLGEAGPG